MLNLRQYKQRASQLSDHLPWAALVAPGIVLNKDGSLQRSLSYYGPDLESATDAELKSTAARANNILRRFGSGWALYFEAVRDEAQGYPKQGAEAGVSRLIDAERRAAFEGQGRPHFESHFYLTLVYLPGPDLVARAGDAFLDGRPDIKTERDWRREISAFVDRTDTVVALFSGFMPFISALNDEQTLTYLHGTVSSRKQRVSVPDTPVYLDVLLADTPLSGGLEPRLGSLHIRSLTLIGFPNHTWPGLLDALNHLDLGYRWVSRFIAVDKTEATQILTRIRRQWFNKRKSLNALLREVLTSQPSALTDSDADNKVADADQALQTLGGDHVNFGYLTTTLTVMDSDLGRVEEKLRRVEQVVTGLGFTVIRETLNAVEAWLGALPGHLYANIRQPLVHTLNLVHLMPLSAVWAGPEDDRHLGGPPLLYALSSGATPFRFCTHVGDVGHMLVLGPTGAGKSVLLSFLALQFQRYPRAQVFIFDKGGSARAATLSLGGRHHRLGRHADLSFQPLKDIHLSAERSWALEWLMTILEHEKVSVTPELKDALWAALNSLSSAPEAERTLTGLSMLLASNDLKAALRAFTLEGAFGNCLDADENGLDLGTVQCFETEDLMAEPSLCLPVLTYLFHRLEERFDGRPTLLILDEAWTFLDNPLFAARIREWLKVLRKVNVSVIFATQSISDIADSTIAPALLEACPQRLFLPNDRATELQSRQAYVRMGLNDRQIDLIGQAIPKRHYYLQSRRGNRLFELGLGPLAMAVCGASSPEDHVLIDSVLSSGHTYGFAAEFLRRKGLIWASDLLV